MNLTVSEKYFFANNRKKVVITKKKKEHDKQFIDMKLKNISTYSILRNSIIRLSQYLGMCMNIFIVL